MTNPVDNKEEAILQLDKRLDDLQKNKVSSYELESIKKSIDDIQIQIAYMNGQLKVLTK